VREWLTHPEVQGGVAPLLAGLAAGIVLYPVRLSGLAAACGFFATVYLTGQLAFERKLLMVSLAAPLLGALADLALRPTRSAGIVLGIVSGIAAFWVFYTTLGQMPAERLVLFAVGIPLLVAATVTFSVLSQDEAPRAGAAGVGLGLATGIIALLGGAKTLALSGFGLAAGAAGFLLIAMLLGRRLVAGTALTLSIGVIGSLLAASVVLQRGLPWYYGALLALVPLAVRLPVQRSAVGQALAALFYVLAVGGGICVLAWMR
jgi:hypothetical protein